jgi:hypothetical protein
VIDDTMNDEARKMKLSRRTQSTPTRSMQQASISILEQNSQMKDLRGELMKRQLDFAEMISQARAVSIKHLGKQK